MAKGTTNYTDTFIEIAEDCPSDTGQVPPVKGDKKTVANLQFEMVYDHPYAYTSDDVMFTVFAQRKGLTKHELDEERALFFSKGQPCFRASPLTKRYGWGIHNDAEGKMAMVAAGTDEYESFVKDASLKKVKAMRSKRI